MAAIGAALGLVRGMLTAAFLILFVVPILYHLSNRLSFFKRPPGPESGEDLLTVSEELALLNKHE